MIKSAFLIFILVQVSYCDLVFLNDSSAATDKCPKYGCSSVADGSCAEAKGKVSDGTRTINAVKCSDDKQTCNVSFVADSDVEGKSSCKTPEEPSKVTYLPGEKCEKNEDCTDVQWWAADEAKTKGECDIPNKVCKGSAKGGKCSSNNSCVAGLYCNVADAEAKVCAEQIAADAACVDHYDCKNDLVCIGEKGKKTCKKAYSLATGASIEVTDYLLNSVGCASGYVNSNKCAIKEHDQKAKGPIKCEHGSSCKYQVYVKDDRTDTPVEKSDKCVCSMNPDGQGWCPYSQGVEGDGTSDLIAKKLAVLDNKRHTVNRQLGDYTPKDVCLAAGLTRNISLKGVDSCYMEAILGAALKDCSASKVFSLFAVAFAMIFLA